MTLKEFKEIIDYRNDNFDIVVYDKEKNEYYDITDCYKINGNIELTIDTYDGPI